MKQQIQVRLALLGREFGLKLYCSQFSALDFIISFLQEMIKHRYLPFSRRKQRYYGDVSTDPIRRAAKDILKD